MPETTQSRTYLNPNRAADLLAQWRESGDSIKDFALSHGLSEATLIRWQRRLRPPVDNREVMSAFVQVQPMGCGEITVHAQGISIQIPVAAIDQSLPAVLRSLRC